jgi:cytochrome c biogenesis protein CcdA/thiol-disulfide isomerase/thioredoxin
MMLFVISYLAGVLTILSPCILPILPIVLARTDQPFARRGLPMLVGMVLSFTAAATLASVASSWAAQANILGRALAILLLATFALTLISSRLAAVLTGPAVRLGNAVSQFADTRKSKIFGSLLLGVATGLVWAPCAGPVLGAVLTGAALQGANLRTAFLLADYAAGAATSIAVAMLAGGKVLSTMKRHIGLAQSVRRISGAAVLASALIIALGIDTTLFAELSYASTARLEQSLFDRAEPPAPQGEPIRLAGDPAAAPYRSSLPVEGKLPSLDGAVTWLNSAPHNAEALRGKVVLVDFWTYSCINCIRTIPYVRAWAEKYKDSGLVVIGVHTPEFAFEKKVENVEQAAKNFKMSYPIAIDSNYKIWRAFSNSYWPALYFIDAKGQIRHHQFGEGNDAGAELVIQDLLAEAAGRKMAAVGATIPSADGAQVAPDLAQMRSEETYVGYDRASGFVSPEDVKPDMAADYSTGDLPLNRWGLKGNWTVGSEKAALNQADGAILYRFLARDLHLVAGPSNPGQPIRFRVTIDGKPPGDDHGTDTDANGEGAIVETRLYQLVRQSGRVRGRAVEIRFLDPGVSAYVFTFG